MPGVARFTLLLLGLLAWSSAHGDERDEARTHSNSARAAFEHADYATALGEFQRAYELAPVPELLYNVGRCYAELGQRPEAAAAYRKYLAAKPAAEDRADVEERIRELEKPGPSGSAPSPATTPATRGQTNPALILDSRNAAPAARTRPWYRKWWPWTLIGVGVVAVAATATGVALSSSSSSNFHAIQVNR